MLLILAVVLLVLGVAALLLGLWGRYWRAGAFVLFTLMQRLGVIAAGVLLIALGYWLFFLPSSLSSGRAEQRVWSSSGTASSTSAETQSAAVVETNAPEPAEEETPARREPSPYSAELAPDAEEKPQLLAAAEPVTAEPAAKPEPAPSAPPPPREAPAPAVMEAPAPKPARVAAAPRAERPKDSRVDVCDIAGDCEPEADAAPVARGPALRTPRSARGSVTLLNTLGPGQTREIVVVWLDGKRAGQLEVSRKKPAASLTVNVPASGDYWLTGVVHFEGGGVSASSGGGQFGSARRYAVASQFADRYAGDLRLEAQP